MFLEDTIGNLCFLMYNHFVYYYVNIYLYEYDDVHTLTSATHNSKIGSSLRR